MDIDVYRNIHKAIRDELFATTTDAGRIDWADECARVALADRVDGLVWLLGAHAHHEDTFFQPLVEAHAPQFAETIVGDHAMLDARIEGIGKTAHEVVGRRDLHELHLELARFTGDYLHHQDLEERDVQPALLAAVGPQVMFETEQALVASIAPPDMARSLSLMLPAMNLDDRTEMLGGMRAGAPAEVFAGVWALAQSVLPAADVTALGRRLGV
jgi:hypothetical protein